MFSSYDGYKFEERDDERTLTSELVPDCDAFYVEATKENCILEYMSQFKMLIEACGKVGYFWNMERCLSPKISKVEVSASTANHTKDFKKQRIEWVNKANIAYAALSIHARRLGIDMPEDEKAFLNALAISKDRRKCYTSYLNNRIEKNLTLSPDELEGFFQKRLEKRLKK